MPLIPNFIENALFMQFQQAPGPLLDIFAGVGQRVVLTALKLNVFEILENKPQTAHQLAQQLKTDPHGTAFLLNALVGLKYVHQQGGQYRNSAMTSKWLVSSGEVNLTPYFLYWGAILPTFYENLEASIQSGKPPLNLYEWIETQPEVSRYFQEGMIALAHFATAEMMGKIKLPASATKLLDVGGGHGMYSIAFCQKFPQLTATIFDSPQALTTARHNVPAQHMEARITFQEGNFVRDDLGTGYDVVLLINIVHGFTPAQNGDLLTKAAKALKPGGQVIVVEQLAGKAPLPLANTINSLLGLTYFHLLGGQMYSYSELEGWLKQTGFREIQHKVMRKVGSSIVSGIRT